VIEAIVMAEPGPQMKEGTDVGFHEEQRIGRPWLLAPMAALAAIMVVMFARGLYQQLVLGQPWGDHPLPDAGLVAAAAVGIGVTVGVCCLLLFMRLVTEVRADGLRLAYWPLRTRVVPWSEIREVEAVSYRPIRDYGGWGIRYGGRRKGWAYNASGNRGVRLTLRDGSRLLAGSQRPEALAQAIRARLPSVRP
jgi:hypothetical protein